MLTLWAFCVSSLPLVVLVALLPWAVVLCRSTLLTSALSGTVRIEPDGQLRGHDMLEQIDLIDCRCLWWVTRLECRSKQSFLVWRDSCRDEEYRHLQRFARDWQRRHAL